MASAGPDRRFTLTAAQRKETAETCDWATKTYKGTQYWHKITRLIQNNAARTHITKGGMQTVIRHIPLPCTFCDHVTDPASDSCNTDRINWWLGFVEGNLRACCDWCTSARRRERSDVFERLGIRYLAEVSQIELDSRKQFNLWLEESVQERAACGFAGQISAKEAVLRSYDMRALLGETVLQFPEEGPISDEALKSCSATFEDDEELERVVPLLWYLVRLRAISSAATGAIVRWMGGLTEVAQKMSESCEESLRRQRSNSSELDDTQIVAMSAAALLPCQYCGRRRYTFEGGHRQDRVVPHSVYALWSTLPCCWICNALKGAGTVAELYARLQAIRDKALAALG